MSETTDASFGAALIAGIGVGIFSDELSAANKCIRVVEIIQPDPARVAFYDRLFVIYKAAQAGLKNVNHELSALIG